MFYLKYNLLYNLLFNLLHNLLFNLLLDQRVTTVSLSLSERVWCMTLQIRLDQASPQSQSQSIRLVPARILLLLILLDFLLIHLLTTTYVDHLGYQTDHPVFETSNFTPTLYFLTSTFITLFSLAPSPNLSEKNKS